MAKPQCPYTCQAVTKVDGQLVTCGKACKAAPDDTLALLGLCREHATERFRTGKAEQRKVVSGG